MAHTGSNAQHPILTLGHGTRTLADLLAVLRREGVQIVADLRAVPRSRRNPQFNREHLLEHLPASGITYHHLKDLGARRRPPLPRRSPNTGLAQPWKAYADYMLGEDFEKSLARVLALAAIGRLALLGSEPDWRRCHRRLVADALLVRGFVVRHCDGEGGCVPHQLTPGAELRRGRLIYPSAGEQLSLFDSI